MTISTVRFLIAAIFITAGMIVFALAVFGVFKIRHGISRLHAAAMGDSSGILLVLIGVMIIYGKPAIIGKLIFMLALFWLASPVCSHLLTMLEASTDEDLGTHCKEMTLAEVEEGLHPERARQQEKTYDRIAETGGDA